MYTESYDRPNAAWEYVNVEVPMEEISAWQSARGFARLHTGGLGPCIGVATYDATSKFGHMGHFALPYDGDDYWEGFLKSVSATTKNSSALKVWVRGGQLLAIESDAEREGARVDRERVVERLALLGVARNNIDVQWSLADVLGVGMELNCADGEFSDLLPADDDYQNLYSGEKL